MHIVTGSNCFFTLLYVCFMLLYTLSTCPFRKGSACLNHNVLGIRYNVNGILPPATESAHATRGMKYAFPCTI